MNGWIKTLQFALLGAVLLAASSLAGCDYAKGIVGSVAGIEANKAAAREASGGNKLIEIKIFTANDADLAAAKADFRKATVRAMCWHAIADDLRANPSDVTASPDIGGLSIAEDLMAAQEQLNSGTMSPVEIGCAPMAIQLLRNGFKIAGPLAAKLGLGSVTGGAGLLLP